MGVCGLDFAKGIRQLELEPNCRSQPLGRIYRAPTKVAVDCPPPTPPADICEPAKNGDVLTLLTYQ